MEAARRDNTELLHEILAKPGVDAAVINSAADPLGNTVLHVAATYGSCTSPLGSGWGEGYGEVVLTIVGGIVTDDVIDILLDQEGLEVDPQNRLDKDTPLHKAVYLARESKEAGHAIVELLLDAGADPR